MIPYPESPRIRQAALVLLLREWYRLPAYTGVRVASGTLTRRARWAWRTYKSRGRAASATGLFLARVFQKLLINFTWWVNRKDPEGRNLFSGGFLGLDNIGVFDRGAPLPAGGHLEQADGTAWMAFYCATMLSIALELASEEPVYEDVASKFFEHFVAITDAINSLGCTGSER